MKDLHHEVELGVVIGKRGKGISASNAMEHIAGYTLALDMTVCRHGLPQSFLTCLSNSFSNLYIIALR